MFDVFHPQCRLVMLLKLGTRGSQLALAQSHMVKQALLATKQDLTVDLIKIKTLGDSKQGTSAASQSDKRDWIQELECAIVNNEIDFAVHSGKDIPAKIHDDTLLLPVLKRASAYDAFIGQQNKESLRRIRFADLPTGATIGTASLRRKAELLKHRPDLKIVEHRGNVTTRIEKLDQSQTLFGIILACAGLERLQMNDLDYETLPEAIMMPAVHQGTLVVQFHKNNKALHEKLSTLVDPQLLSAWRAERAVAEILEGDCKSAISIFATTNSDTVHLRAQVMLPDGQQYIAHQASDKLDNATALGISLGQHLIDMGASKIIAASSQL